MPLGSMLRDVASALFTKPVTEEYPVKVTAAPPRLRGKLVWNPDKCSGCGLCAKDCPSDALEVVVIDRKQKQFVIIYHLDRCTFCAQCVQNCRFGCMQMDDQCWELAAFDPESFTYYYGDPEGVDAYLASQAESGAASSDAPSSDADASGE